MKLTIWVCLDPIEFVCQPPPTLMKLLNSKLFKASFSMNMVNFYEKVIAQKLDLESILNVESIRGAREVTGGPAPSQTESLEHQTTPPLNIKQVKSLSSSLWNIKP